MKPRMPYSPPPTPTITLSFTTSGAMADRVAVRDLGDLDVPERAAGLRVDRDEVRVERAHEQRVAEDREAAVVGAAADLDVRRDGVLVDPEDAAGLRVERDHVVRPLREVHDAVDDERRRLPRSEHLVLENPLQLEVLDVGRRDLRQRAVALAGVVAGVGQPVLRLVRGAQKPVRRHLCANANGHDRQQHEEQTLPHACHCRAPVSDIR